jgi:hypothetical protein
VNEGAAVVANDWLCICYTWSDLHVVGEQNGNRYLVEYNLEATLSVELDTYVAFSYAFSLSVLTIFMTWPGPAELM